MDFNEIKYYINLKNVGFEIKKIQYFVENTGFWAFSVSYFQEKFIKLKKKSGFISKIKGKKSVKSKPYDC